MPVILAAYDARTDRAWWLHVQGHFKETVGFGTRETLTVSLPCGNLLDRQAMKSFARMKKLILDSERKGYHYGD